LQRDITSGRLDARPSSDGPHPIDTQFAKLIARLARSSYPVEIAKTPLVSSSPRRGQELSTLEKGGSSVYDDVEFDGKESSSPWSICMFQNVLLGQELIRRRTTENLIQDGGISVSIPHIQD